ncbi:MULTISPECIES: metallophosphoesterase family protein [unclassified Romboutsia]|uniref:metallophosphoesterase family protein n=1 Tax=unclassified Romboutsia TaxID=2626894 RepID=UPI000822DC4E|nr:MULTISPECIES: metallophosphoesterase family protein [unclassified Romboutsia]SCI32826.1 phosphodiesterase [uncultured Clostridium sp.]
MIIGIISDTHGLLRQEVLQELNNCELIIHAGDVGKNDIINSLQQICRTEFVYGNIDKDNDTSGKVININKLKIYLIHNIKDIKEPLNKKDIDIIVYGHSHRSKIYIEEGILYINPGSVGPKRFKLEPTMAKLYIKENIIKENIFEFEGYKVEIIKLRD